MQDIMEGVEYRMNLEGLDTDVLKELEQVVDCISLKLFSQINSHWFQVWKKNIANLSCGVLEEYAEKPKRFWNSETHRFEYERLGGVVERSRENGAPESLQRNLDDPDLNSDDDVPEQEEVLKSENFGFVLGVNNDTFNNLKREKTKHTTLEVFS